LDSLRKVNCLLEVFMNTIGKIRVMFLVILIAVILNVNLGNPKKVDAQSVDIGWPFPPCETWYVLQGYNSDGKSHQGWNAFDLLKNSSWNDAESGLATIVAPMSGTIGKIYTWYIDGYTNWAVQIDNGRYSIQLNHLERPATLSVGQSVSKGDYIGNIFNQKLGGYKHLDIVLFIDGINVPFDVPGTVWQFPSNGPRPSSWGTWAETKLQSSCQTPNGNFALLSLQVGHLEIFRRDPSGAANHRWWDGGASWVGSWDPLGITISGTPSIVSWGPDRQDFFVHAADGAIYRQTWTRGGVRGPWIHMPGLTTNDDLTAFSLQLGHLEVLANGGGILYHNWSDDAGVTWSSWQSLGIRNRGVPTVITSGPDHQDLFVHGEDNVIYHQTWTRTGGRTNWTSMNGTTYDDIAVISPQPGHLVAFVRGTDGYLYHSWSTDTGVTWSGWVGLGIKLIGKPAVVSWAPDRTDVVVRGEDDVMYHLAYTSSGWGNWESLGGQTKFAPQAISWGKDRLDVFHIGLDGNFYHKWWTGSLQSAWYQVGTYQYVPPHIILSPLQLTRGAQQNESGSGFTPNGPLHMSIRLPDGTYYEQALQADANGSFGYPYTMPMNAQFGHYAYRIQDLTTGVWSNTVEYDVLDSTPPVTPPTATATPPTVTATTVTMTPTATATRTATATAVTTTPTATATRTATPVTATPPTVTAIPPTVTAIPPTATPTTTTGSVLALVPAATTLSVGGTLAVAVEVRSGTQPIDGAAVYLDFDPAVLEIVSVIPSASLPISLTQKIDPLGGHLDLVRGAISSLPQGTFSLATVTFRARTAAPTGTSLSISRTTARPSDVSFGGVSKLGQTIPATLTIRDGVLNDN
jgi:Peptidase family M23/Cohesin domain